jgi:hypothetical protein
LLPGDDFPPIEIPSILAGFPSQSNFDFLHGTAAVHVCLQYILHARDIVGMQKAFEKGRRGIHVFWLIAE